MDKRQITDYDYKRLDALLKEAPVEFRNSDIFKKFSTELSSAQILPQKKISKSVVTMNTRVRLIELTSKKKIEVTITYPKEANANERRISVFSLIGVELLGRKLGDTVSWAIPGGMGRFEIMEVTFQPESVGNYDL
ncbi:MAG: GreA/GreB family elongation factor [Cyclobacteriaceae bacterium]|nr:GreA/GreB family elongation factor [Cyclobacteriaceae bacterium]